MPPGRPRHPASSSGRLGRPLHGTAAATRHADRAHSPSDAPATTCCNLLSHVVTVIGGLLRSSCRQSLIFHSTHLDPLGGPHECDDPLATTAAAPPPATRMLVCADLKCPECDFLTLAALSDDTQMTLRSRLESTKAPKLATSEHAFLRQALPLRRGAAAQASHEHHPERRCQCLSLSRRLTTETL